MFSAILLGLVEGITEFLPVSSTGHLLLTQHLLGHQQSDAFNVLIQVGPIFAAVLVFWKYIVSLLTGWNDPVRRDELIKLAAAFVLTGIGGLILKKLDVELPESAAPIAWATLIGAFVIWGVEWKARKQIGSTQLTWAVVAVIAGSQLLAAVFPGTSRSGAVIMGALLLGLDRAVAVRAAFLVGIPTMFAAASLQVLGAVRDGQGAELVSPESLVAFVVATVSAFVAVRWLLKYVQTRDFVPFAWYRLVLALVTFALMVPESWPAQLVHWVVG